MEAHEFYIIYAMPFKIEYIENIGEKSETQKKKTVIKKKTWAFYPGPCNIFITYFIFHALVKCSEDEEP